MATNNDDEKSEEKNKSKMKRIRNMKAFKRNVDSLLTNLRFGLVFYMFYISIVVHFLLVQTPTTKIFILLSRCRLLFSITYTSTIHLLLCLQTYLHRYYGENCILYKIHATCIECRIKE